MTRCGVRIVALCLVAGAFLVGVSIGAKVTWGTVHAVSTVPVAGNLTPCHDDRWRDQP